jgi:hypothetical protein
MVIGAKRSVLFVEYLIRNMGRSIVKLCNDSRHREILVVIAGSLDRNIITIIIKIIIILITISTTILTPTSPPQPVHPWKLLVVFHQFHLLTVGTLL